MDPEVKHQLDVFCADVGMNTSTAINLFTHAVIRDRKLPFEIAAPQLTEAELLERAQDLKENRNIIIHDLIDD